MSYNFLSNLGILAYCIDMSAAEFFHVQQQHLWQCTCRRFSLTNPRNVHLRGTEQNTPVWKRINSLILKPLWIYINVMLRLSEEQILDMVVFMFLYSVVSLYENR